MPYPTINEKIGGLSAVGVAKETTFGTAVSATNMLPVHSVNIEADPGAFSPGVLFNRREKNLFPLTGAQKFAGTLDAPLFPSMGVALLAGALGQSNGTLAGVVGTAGGGVSTTIGVAGVLAGATVINVAATTGMVAGTTLIQVGNNTTETSEIRKVVSIAGLNVTIDSPLTYNHLGSGALISVVAPFTHILSPNTTGNIPSFTIEKNIGNFESQQFYGCRVGKYSLKTAAANSEASFTADVEGRGYNTLATPTTMTMVNELPFRFADITVSAFGQSLSQASTFDLTLDNSLKSTYTFAGAGNQGPSFLTPGQLNVSGTIGVVWNSFDDANFGFVSKAMNNTAGACTLTLSNGSTSIIFSLPKITLNKVSDAIALDGVVMETLTYNAFYPIGTTNSTISATVVNQSQYLPY